MQPVDHDRTAAVAAADAAARSLEPVRMRPLLAAAAGDEVRIGHLPAHHRHALEQEGLAEGVTIVVERRLALGGPVIVRVGRARVAVARSVAGQIVVGDAAADGAAQDLP